MMVMVVVVVTSWRVSSNSSSNNSTNSNSSKKWVRTDKVGAGWWRCRWWTCCLDACLQSRCLDRTSVWFIYLVYACLFVASGGRLTGQCLCSVA